MKEREHLLKGLWNLQNSWMTWRFESKTKFLIQQLTRCTPVSPWSPSSPSPSLSPRSRPWSWWRAAPSRASQPSNRSSRGRPPASCTPATAFYLRTGTSSTQGSDVHNIRDINILNLTSGQTEWQSLQEQRDILNSHSLHPPSNLWRGVTILKKIEFNFFFKACPRCLYLNIWPTAGHWGYWTLSGGQDQPPPLHKHQLHQPRHHHQLHQLIQNRSRDSRFRSWNEFWCYISKP